MTQLPPTIRKAAVLVSTLDERAADALLEQMGAETAARVRSALMELGDVPVAEQQAVLAEFFQGKQPPRPAVHRAADTGVELDASLAGLLDGPFPVVSPSIAPPPLPRQPFAFLRDVPPAATAKALAGEQPQLIALVVARLEADLAAELLEQLPPALATEVLERMAWLEEPLPEVLDEIERHLRALLASHATSRTPALAGVQALLGAMGAAARERVLSGLGIRNSALAGQLGYRQPEYAVNHSRYRIERSSVNSPTRAAVPLIEFDDFLTLSDEALRRVFAAADPQVVLLALTEADEPLLARITRQLSQREAATLRARLNHPGAVRLSDMRAAQQQLADLARRLAEEGAIVLPGSRHFAAAA